MMSGNDSYRKYVHDEHTHTLYIIMFNYTQKLKRSMDKIGCNHIYTPWSFYRNPVRLPQTPWSHSKELLSPVLVVAQRSWSMMRKGIRTCSLLTVLTCVTLLARCHSQGGDIYSAHLCIRKLPTIIYIYKEHTFNIMLLYYCKAVHSQDHLWRWMAIHTTVIAHLGIQFPLELRSS